MNFDKEMYDTLVNQYIKDYKNRPNTLLGLMEDQYDDMMAKSVTDTSYPLNMTTYNAMFDAYGIITGKRWF